MTKLSFVEVVVCEMVKTMRFLVTVAQYRYSFAKLIPLSSRELAE